VVKSWSIKKRRTTYTRGRCLLILCHEIAFSTDTKTFVFIVKQGLSVCLKNNDFTLLKMQLLGSVTYGLRVN
jgi:hypothetical protein